MGFDKSAVDSAMAEDRFWAPICVQNYESTFGAHLVLLGYGQGSMEDIYICLLGYGRGLIMVYSATAEDYLWSTRLRPRTSNGLLGYGRGQLRLYPFYSAMAEE